MKRRRVWTEGRLSWPLFAVLVFAGLSYLCLDLVWRWVEAPIKTLLIQFAVLDLLAAAIVATIGWRVSRRRSDRGSAGQD